MVTTYRASRGGSAAARVEMPLWARLHLTHAVMQAIADEAGADILHLKGPSVAAELRSAPRRSVDVDVLVRPAHLDRFLSVVEQHGWFLKTSFAGGSSFGHAANYGHADWAFVDVHRDFPGPTVPPAHVFDELWLGRQSLDIAHKSCAVPDLAAQVLILALHEARSHHARGTFEAWELSPAERQGDVWALARRLGAEVPLAAAVGRLGEFADRRDYLWWKFWSEPESGDPAASRLAEWTARLHATRGIRERLVVLASMVRVNRTYLQMQLGHEPNHRDVLREYRHRIGEGWRAVYSRLRARLRALLRAGGAG